MDRKVVFEPKYPPTPAECRTTQAVYAFYCSIDLTIYINTSQLRLWQGEISAEQAPYALAMTLAHEFGHAVQNQLDEDTVDEFGPHIELQADCLAGVWVGYAVRHDGLSRDSLLRAWRQETELLDTDDHRDTHGSADQRLAATSRGIAGGSSHGLRAARPVSTVGGRKDGYRDRVSSTAASALCLWGVSGAPADEILTAWRLHGPRAGVRWMGGEHARETDPTVAALPGSGTASGSTALLLPLLRDQRPELVLPRAGDLRGLPIDQPALREAALASGAAVVLPDRGVTIVAIDEQWRIWPGAAGQPPLDAPAVRDELDAAVTRAALLFARHELGIDALDARRSVLEHQDRLTFPLPPGAPSRAAALLQRAVTLEAILAVAGRDRSAAVTAVEGARVDAALAPLAAVARDARRVAVQLVVREFSGAEDRATVHEQMSARDRTG